MQFEYSCRQMQINPCRLVVKVNSVRWSEMHSVCTPQWCSTNRAHRIDCNVLHMLLQPYGPWRPSNRALDGTLQHNRYRRLSWSLPNSGVCLCVCPCFKKKAVSAVVLTHAHYRHTLTVRSKGQRMNLVVKCFLRFTTAARSNAQRMCERPFRLKVSERRGDGPHVDTTVHFF